MRNYDAFIKDLSELIAIESTEGKRETGAPFGKGAKTALVRFLQKAESFGFKTVNYDNYAGEITYGEGQEIGIIGHLDVVPAGKEWSYPPFRLTENNGYLIGRGVSDDKGAMLALLYCLKELKDSGAPCNKKFRFFVGTNEESGWQDVAYLKTKTAIPEYGFSPDGNFPVSYAEKGFYFVRIKLPPFKRFGGITGGTVINAVCAEARVKPRFTPDKNQLERYELEFDGTHIISRGVAAHGSKPHLGKNALFPLMEFIRDCGEDADDAVNYLFKDAWRICVMENEQGFVTFSPDLAEETSDGGTLISCDMRIPAPFTVETVKENMRGCPLDIEITDHDHPPVMIEKDGKFVQTLLTAYNAFADKKGAPVSMGGSTFARVFKKGCAFGPEFPQEDCHIHEADERVSEKALLKAYDIYKKAIFDLAAIKETF